MTRATITANEREGRTEVALAGDWTLINLPRPIAGLEARLRNFAERGAAWDLHALDRLDSVGAILLWRAWNRLWPDALSVGAQHRAILERAAAIKGEAPAAPGISNPLVQLGQLVFSAAKNVVDVITLIGQLVLDVGHLIVHPSDIPWREFSANLYRSGAQALPVTALVGFLIGVVLSFLSSLQLKIFGADVYIVNLLGVSITRELAPVIVAVLVAGRSGSAMTAQIGVMRVTEEIDALATMGVSRSLRLILPKVVALSITMPLLILWCASAALIGGMFSAKLEMGLDYGYFIEALPRVVPVANLWIGLGKGFFFGLLIALIACHFGLKVRPNTESLSSRTTMAVVSAITTVIIVDAIFAVVTRHVGLPGSA
jgi:phospholipid/cholesterol/gamma-HCH transport system permease protein